MRHSIVAATLFAPVALLLSVAPIAADPQMLAVVRTASAIPLQCDNGECGAELSSICLHEQRATPSFGHRYYAHDDSSIGLTGIRRDGSRVALAVAGALQFSAARGYSAVRVSVPADVLQQHDVASLEISVGARLSLVPEKGTRDDTHPLSDEDIAFGAGPLRRTASALVDQDLDKGHASQVIAHLINGLPKWGAANVEVRTTLWDVAATPNITALSRRGAHRAKSTYNACYRQTRIGDVTLRECLSTAHDRFMQELNHGYWDAVKTAS